MSVEAIGWAKGQQTGCPVMKAVLVEIADGVQFDGVARLYVEAWARKTEFPVAAIESALVSLAEAGFLAEHPEGALLAMPLGQQAYQPRPPGWASLRARVFARDGYACTYCGSSGPLHCDHVLPRSRGGADAEENLTTACAPCNVSKRDRTPEEWGGRRL